jgi:hypothetical protein
MRPVTALKTNDSEGPSATLTSWVFGVVVDLSFGSTGPGSTCLGSLGLIDVLCFTLLYSPFCFSPCSSLASCIFFFLLFFFLANRNLHDHKLSDFVPFE